MEVAELVELRLADGITFVQQARIFESIALDEVLLPYRGFILGPFSIRESARVLDDDRSALVLLDRHGIAPDATLIQAWAVQCA